MRLLFYKKGWVRANVELIGSRKKRTYYEILRKELIMKRIMIMLCVALLMISSFTTVAMADTTVISCTNGSHTFKDDWTEAKTVTYKNSQNILTYGFNTFLINEDFAYAYSNGDYHYSRIVRSTLDVVDGPKQYANYWSDLEIQHKTSSVTYKNMWVDW